MGGTRAQKEGNGLLSGDGPMPARALPMPNRALPMPARALPVTRLLAAWNEGMQVTGIAERVGAGLARHDSGPGELPLANPAPCPQGGHMSQKESHGKTLAHVGVRRRKFSIPACGTRAVSMRATCRMASFAQLRTVRVSEDLGKMLGDGGDSGCRWPLVALSDPRARQ